MRRILVVDDDAHVGQAIGLWLKHNGFACPPPTVDPSGLAALDNATFDLMIVDVFFPGMRGFEAIRLFHQRAPSVPLVVIPVPPFRNGMVPLPIFSGLRPPLARRAACASHSSPRPCLVSSANALPRPNRIGDRSQPSGQLPKPCWTTRWPALPGGSAGACREVGRRDDLGGCGTDHPRRLE